MLSDETVVWRVRCLLATAAAATFVGFKRWLMVALFLAAGSAIVSGSSLFLEEKYTRVSGYLAAILIIVIPSLGWERKSDRHMKASREYERIALDICTAIRMETQDETFSSFEHRYGAKMQDLALDPEVDPPALIANRSMELVYDILNDEVELAKRVPAARGSSDTNTAAFETDTLLSNTGVPMPLVPRASPRDAGELGLQIPPQLASSTGPAEQPTVIDIWSDAP